MKRHFFAGSLDPPPSPFGLGREESGGEKVLAGGRPRIHQGRRVIQVLRVEFAVRRIVFFYFNLVFLGSRVSATCSFEMNMNAINGNGGGQAAVGQGQVRVGWV